MNLHPPEPGQCAVCRLTEFGWGYLPPDKRGKAKVKPTWTCREDILLAEVVHKMPSRDMNAMELLSLQDAAAEAGAYLDSIGKTDLSTLTPEEWSSFWIIGLNRYGEKLRDRLKAGEAPF